MSIQFYQIAHFNLTEIIKSIHFMIQLIFKTHINKELQKLNLIYIERAE